MLNLNGSDALFPHCNISSVAECGRPDKSPPRHAARREKVLPTCAADTGHISLLHRPTRPDSRASDHCIALDQFA
jgi:hypothetical protein